MQHKVNLAINLQTMRRLSALLIPACMGILVSCQQKPANNDEHWVISAPAGSRYTHINKDSVTIIPNGRLLTPTGKQIMVAPHPYGLTLSADGKIAVTANSGTSPLSISIIRNLDSGNPQVQQVPDGAETNKGILASVFMGLAIAPDNSKVYVAGGQENKVYIFNLADGSPAGTINCETKDKDHHYIDGYIGDMAMNKDGSRLYAVDQTNFRMVIIDTKAGKVIQSVPVGRYPFGITLSPDEKSVYVANVGMYEYKYLNSFDPNNRQATSLPYPTSAYLSKDAEEGYKRDSVDVPGLGKPNVPESFSVWKIDVSGNSASSVAEQKHLNYPIESNAKVTAKIKTGFLVGQMIEGIPAVGGASPNSLVATDQYVFTSNGNNDCISVIDTKKDTVVKTIFIKPDDRLKHYRGVIPFGLALSPDQKRLYVCEAGINAVGVIDIATMSVVGHIPTAWFPAKLKVSPDGKQLIVTNAKGYGSGPNAGPDFHQGPEGSNIGHLMKGTVSIIDIPTDEQLKGLTDKVLANNFQFNKANEQVFDGRTNNPVPLYPKQKDSPIKYIVFIAKENRNYDEVLGQIKNGNGLASIARFGADVSFHNEANTMQVDHCTVMPNHLALAHRFSIGDNFYCDSDHSADGHRWLACTYPNEWVETSVSAAYGDNRSWKQGSPAPGMNLFVGSNASVYPEDYNEAGTIWDHLDRNKIPFFNFGFGLEMAPGWEEPEFKYSGSHTIINYPVSAPLYNNSSHLYATFNMGVPDQFRIDMFTKEFNEKFMGQGKTMPPVLTIDIPNDHGAGERPKDGYPFKESYMADNDLALGRVIDFLSHSPYWKNMMIVVTEDDAQGGVDHVDAHRSVCMMISPYSKKDYAGHVHYSFGSIFKTFWNILGLPYLNQYDAGATDMSDLLTDKPDFTPYTVLPVDKRIFDVDSVTKPFDAKFNWDAVKKSPVMDDPEDMERNSREYDQLKKEQEKKNSHR